MADTAAGLYETTRIYDDSSVKDIESLPITQLHRPIDVTITSAGTEGYVKTYIILPSTIYGIVKNPLVDAGIQNPHSIQVPAIIRASIDRGQGGMVGDGKNIWPNVANVDVREELMRLQVADLDNKRMGTIRLAVDDQLRHYSSEISCPA